jgi:glycosyltransferase involved in cell wall biosynthesis
MTSDVTVIILTLNEEQNIAQALSSVCGWAKRVVVFDSYSIDRTIEIASKFGCEISQHKFVDYAKQRNAALDTLRDGTGWVLFLDADEWITAELKDEISSLLAGEPVENGFYIKRRLIWMGRWIRRGYYPTWILRLFRLGKGRCEDRSVNEHIVVEGKCGYLTHDFIHEDRKGLWDWIARHNRYSTLEAEELLRTNADGQIEARLWGGSPSERKRWIRSRVWNQLPPLVRPFVYFGYRYVLRGGFLDGQAGFTYHFLQGLCFRMLIDVKYLELRQRIGASLAVAVSDDSPVERPVVSSRAGRRGESR